MRIVDLSHTIKASPPQVPEALRVDLNYSDHVEGARQIKKMFGIEEFLLRDGEGWAVEEFSRFGTHSSTHVDAPYHYNSTIQGRPAKTIDELPLEWFFNDGVVIDMTAKTDPGPVTPEQMATAFERIGYAPKPLDIVLVRTGSDEFYERPDYMFHGCGVTAGATRWLYDRGVRVMGIDAWGWDAPLNEQARQALEKKKPGVFWAAHQADLEYSQIERLTNLGALPPTGFRVACFPLKIHRASAAPARVVALIP
jgi:kynurenine formamidase